MKIFKVKDLMAQEMKIDEIVLKVVEKPEPRQVKTRYGMSDVCDVLVGDETGKISLTLWGKHINRVEIGWCIRLTDAWINVWQGKPQLSIGKGRMEIIDENSITKVL